MKQQISAYEQKAIDFLAATNTTFKADFIKNDKYFDDDKEARDIYSITLSNDRTYKFNFGQSINNSGQYKLLDHSLIKKFGRNTISAAEYGKLNLYDKREAIANENYSKPTPYDVLACLTKYDPGTFDEFCAEFGYNTDSKKAEKTYLAVRDEYTAIQTLFTENQIESLREIM